MQFRIKINYKIKASDDEYFYSRTHERVLNGPDTVLLMNSFMNEDDWICIEDVETSKKTKKKVGFATEFKNVISIDVYPVHPKQPDEDED